MRDLLTETGSIFVQIGNENVHRVRAVMDEVFKEQCAICEIVVKKKGAQKSTLIDPVNDFILWYGKSTRASGKVKFRTLFEDRPIDFEAVDYFSKLELPSGEIVNLKDKDVLKNCDYRMHPERLTIDFPGGRLLRQWPITNGGFRQNQMHPVSFRGKEFHPPKGRCWSHISLPNGPKLTPMERVRAADRLMASGISLDFKRYHDDFPFKNISNWWDGFRGALDQVYIVQTNERLIERCILMTTDPGDLVLDPTCGSGTTALVAEQWGRRWITIDTSRVALALARTRLMATEYSYYLLADSAEGHKKEQEITGKVQLQTSSGGDIRQGFIYRRVQYVTSGAIANNSQIEDIWEKWQVVLEPLRAQFNAAASSAWEEGQASRDVPTAAPAAAKEAHAKWWKARLARQKEIDASISARAEVEYLYDKPYVD